MSSKQSVSKRILKKSVYGTKRIILSNQYSAKAARRLKSIIRRAVADSPQELYDYNLFYPSIYEYKKQLDSVGNLKKKPVISILLPTYNTDEKFLRDCIDSVLVQSYPHWELCISDDASPDLNVKKVIKEYADKDSRIKYTIRRKNGHISESTNSALELATGEYIALLDHDDILWPNALYEMAKVINDRPSVQFIYTDEDKIDSHNTYHSYPFFKPDWSPEFLESCNYITHFSCFKAELMRSIGGFRKGYEGAQDWDIILRATEQINNPKDIVHIAKVLYSWRVHEASTAQDTDSKPYVYEAQRKLLIDHIARQGVEGKVVKGAIPQHSYTKYTYNASKPIVLWLYGNNQENIEIWNGVTNHLQKITTVNDAPKGSVVVAVNTDVVEAPRDTAEIEQLAADAWRDNIAAVMPRLTLGDNRVATAGLAGAGGKLISLLVGSDKDDPHYMRGLYGRSRRNILAVSATMFAINTTVLKKAKITKPSDVVVASLKLTGKGYRNIYNPNITLTAKSFPIEDNVTFSQIDPYFNVNYQQDSPMFIVKGGK